MSGNPIGLLTLLGDHATWRAIRRGTLTSPLVAFDFDDVKVPNTMFKALVREAKYDLAELAIVTFLQAREAGKPYILLPVTIMGRGQLPLLYMDSARPLTPDRLAGKRIGTRSYTVTTGAWVRGLLRDLYGVDDSRITWVTVEDPHVAEYRDPPNVERAPQGTSLDAMLRAGGIDAVILGAPAEPPLVTLVPDAARRESEWAQNNGGVPINHMLAMRGDLARERPELVREIYRLFREAKAAAPALSLDPVRIGIEANRKSLEKIVAYCLRQKLITQAVTVDALFADARAALGDV